MRAVAEPGRFRRPERPDFNEVSQDLSVFGSRTSAPMTCEWTPVRAPKKYLTPPVQPSCCEASQAKEAGRLPPTAGLANQTGALR